MNSDTQILFHRLSVDSPQDTRLNNPFYYEPDALALAAAHELQAHLPAHPEEGKMWGVLIVEYNGEVGFINAYSGQISDGMRTEIGEEWCGCPPVFDYLQPDGYFKTHENEITGINHRIDSLLGAEDYLNCIKTVDDIRHTAEAEIEKKRTAMNSAKARRHERRKMGNLTEKENASMIRESQFLKAELHRTKQFYNEKIAAAEGEQNRYKKEIDFLRRKRSLMSDRLQSWLFNQFVLLNAKGESKPMPEIFSKYYLDNNTSFAKNVIGSGHSSSFIPSGAGECCEPKMLQYAFSHGMHPLRIASFWWGPSLGGDVRQHGRFYPACSGRCKPILGWMLQGLDVKPNPLETSAHQKLKVIYEDDDLVVVAKPSGMLSVPGKGDRESVMSVLADKWSGAINPLPVHRLDMATSGLMVVAKNEATQASLRAEFEQRVVSKNYMAIVEGKLPLTSGTIRLPLSADLLDRPRQKVDFEHGKPSITEYTVLSSANGESRLLLKPLTGRTHQLRVHCASPLGLDAPIKGDTLYGKSADRLYLQAYKLSFLHPTLHKRMTFTLPLEF